MFVVVGGGVAFGATALAMGLLKYSLDDITSVLQLEVGVLAIVLTPLLGAML